ncbi:MAG: hypothetical protein KAH44_13635 [Oricola sp.]|nr:hypothetical protein [Oricola sp.]
MSTPTKKPAPRVVKGEKKKQTKTNTRRTTRPGESKTSPRRLRAKEKHVKALELRKQGMSYRKIADALGYKDVSSAYRSIMSAIEEIRREPAEACLKLELERLDSLLAGLWSEATKGDSRKVDSALRVAERRSRLLGLDQKIAVALGDDGEIDMLRLISMPTGLKIAVPRDGVNMLSYFRGEGSPPGCAVKVFAPVGAKHPKTFIEACACWPVFLYPVNDDQQ